MATCSLFFRPATTSVTPGHQAGQGDAGVLHFIAQGGRARIDERFGAVRVRACPCRPVAAGRLRSAGHNHVRRPGMPGDNQYQMRRRSRWPMAELHSIPSRDAPGCSKGEEPLPTGYFPSPAAHPMSDKAGGSRHANFACGASARKATGGLESNLQTAKGKPPQAVNTHRRLIASDCCRCATVSAQRPYADQPDVAPDRESRPGRQPHEHGEDGCSDGAGWINGSGGAVTLPRRAKAQHGP